MVQDQPAGDVTGLVTAVSLAGVGGWLVLRLIKFASGRIDAEERRIQNQEQEVVALRTRVTELSAETAKCHAEHAAARETVARLERRVQDLEGASHG